MSTSYNIDPSGTVFNHSTSNISSSIDLTPSLVYSDISDDSEVLAPVDKLANAMSNMAIGGGQETRLDASTVVQEVLEKLDLVVEHLRKQGDNDAANDIAKSICEFVQTFNAATAPWDLQSFQMIVPAARQSTGLANTGTTAQPRPAVATVGSWASVAAKPVQHGNNPIVKYQPSDSLVMRYQEPQPAPEDLRVVWIMGWAENRPLGQISEYVNQGPICSIAYSAEHNAVCIVFQYGESAQSLVESCKMYEAEEGVCLFGGGCSIMLGQGYRMSDDIRRMSSPINERRRLTFARSQLFAHGMTEAKFREDIYEIVGATNVELVWLFNSGNATVVFTSTNIARIVRESFLQRSKTRGPYENVAVSYSHDPCEKPMNLISQIGVPQMKRPRSESTRSSNAGANGNGLHRANTRNSGNGGLGRRQSKRTVVAPKKDDDGWQTVTHKK